MPIARCSLRCGSSNAFHPQAALWNLFLEQQPSKLSNTRCFSSSQRDFKDAQSPIKTTQNNEKGPEKSVSIPPSHYIKRANLRDTLQTLRAKNRDRLLAQDSPSAEEAPTKGHEDGGSISKVLHDELSPFGQPMRPNETDILFESRNFDLNKFSFPQSASFEQPQAKPPAKTDEVVQAHRKSKQRPAKPTAKADEIVQAKMSHSAAELLEYEGMYVKPSLGAARPGQEYPWIKDITPGIWGRRRLDEEVLKFLEYIKPTPAEEAATRAVTQEIRDVIKQKSRYHETEVFGSQTTGLVLATSDIDIRLYEPTSKDMAAAPNHFGRREMSAHVSRLCQRLSLETSKYIMVRMRHARYPLITMLHKESGLDIQIVASNDTSKSRQVIKQYLDEIPNLYAIFALLKVTLDIRGLADVYRGGLGSYSLFMMIVVALKINKQKFPDKEGQALAGSQFLGVLRFFDLFDVYNRALTLHPPYAVNKHDLDTSVPKKLVDQFGEGPLLEGLHKLSLVDPTQPYLLCLQDPADNLNDLGRKAYGYKHIRKTFGHLWEVINLEQKRSAHAVWPKQSSLLAAAVGPCFDAYAARRAITEAYGQKILDEEWAKKEAEEEAERAKKKDEEKAAEQKAVAAETADI